MNLVRALKTTLLAAALTLPLAPGLAGAEELLSTASGKTFALRVPETGIPRFAEICPGLSRGGNPGEEGIRYLRDKGYRTIVSFLTGADESTLVVNSGMKYVHIPMRSSFFRAEPPTSEQVRQFLAVVRDSTLYPVFMHCRAGKDRTGAMSAVYRMEACGWTKDEAVEEMMSFGFSGRYKRLKRFVQEYPGRPAEPVAAADTVAAVPQPASPAAVSK